MLCGCWVKGLGGKTAASKWPAGGRGSFPRSDKPWGRGSPTLSAPPINWGQPAPAAPGKVTHPAQHRQPPNPRKVFCSTHGCPAVPSALRLETDPASPRFTLASCHSASIRLLKIIRRQQREGDEYPSLHSFASRSFFILADGAGWADVAALSSQGALGAGGRSAFPHPPSS